MAASSARKKMRCAERSESRDETVDFEIWQFFVVEEYATTFREGDKSDKRCQQQGAKSMDATKQTCWACDAWRACSRIGKVPIDPTKQTRWAYDAWRACSRRGKVLSATSSSSKLQASKSNLNLPEGENISKPKAHNSRFEIEARSSKLQASCSKLCEEDELSLPRANESSDGSFVRETKEQTCLKLKRQVPSSSILREKMYVAGQVPSSSFLREKEKMWLGKSQAQCIPINIVLETKLDLRRDGPFIYRLYAIACNGSILLEYFLQVSFPRECEIIQSQYLISR